METQLEIALDLAYLDQNRLRALAQESYEVLRLLNRLIESLRRTRPVLP